MKPRRLSAARLSFPLAMAITALLAAPCAHAATLTWDAGGAGGAITNGAGAWLGAGLWNNAGTAATWTSGDDAIFAGPATAGGAVTLASATVVNSLTFSPSFTGTYALGTTARVITLNTGITKNASSAAVTIASPITLGAAQTWTNSSGANLTPQAGINNGGFLLTIGGSGPTVMNTTANVISGSGGLTKNGSGMLTLGGAGVNPVHLYSGTTTITTGIVQVYNMGTNGVPSGNLTITGGVLQDYFGNGGTFTRALGSGAGQVQITGGTSGFSGAGATSSTFNIGGASAQLVWGSTFFSPTVLALQSTNVNLNGKMSLTNGISLAGTTRTITVLGGDTTGGATLSGVITHTTGTAGITKTGVGNLILSAANTFNGATTISDGWLTLTNALALQNSALDTTASVLGSATDGLRTTATTLTLGGLTGTRNFAATGGVFSSTTGGYGTVTALTLNPATGQTPSYSGILANGAAGMTLTKSGAGTQTLSGPNTYTGLTTISAGVLRIANNTALGTTAGGVTQSGTSALEIDGTAGAVTVGAEALSINGGGITNLGALRNIAGNNNYGGTVTMAAQSRINSDSGTLTLSNPTAAVSSSNLTLVVGGAGNLTISGPVALGTGGVSKADGANNLTLSGNNTFTGGLAITAGTVQLGNAGALNSTAGSENAVTFAASSTGTLALGGNSLVIRSLTSNATPGTPVVENANAGNASLTIGNSLNLASSFAGVIRDGTGGGTLGLTKAGTNTLTLSGDNSYTGATLVSTGTLTLSGAGDINSSSGIEVNGSGAKLLQTSSVAASPAVTLTQGTLTGSGTVNTVNVGDATGGILSNNDGVAGAALTIGALTFNGAATVNTFGNASAPIVTTSLATNVAGSITINPSAASWTPGIYDLISYGGGSVTGAGSGQFVLGTVTGTTARQTKTLGDSTTAITLTIGADDIPYWVGDGDGKWNLASTNNWKLTSDNSYTTFLASDNVLFNDSATGVGPIAVDIDAANVTPNSTTFNNTTKDYTLGGAFGISTGSLTKSGTGTVTLGTVNTYTGASAINAGTIVLSGSGTLGTGSALTLGGGKLDLGTLSTTVGAVSITAPAASGDTILNGSLTGTSYAASNATGNAVVSANLLVNGGAGFTKTGTGTVTLTGANTYTGSTTIGAGILSASSSAALGSGTATNTLVFTGGTLQAGGVITSPSTRLVTLTSTGVIDTNNNPVTIDGIIGGAGGLTKDGAGTLNSSAFNTFSGPITINAGTLEFSRVTSSGTNVFLSTQININNGSTLRISGGGGSNIPIYDGRTYTFDAGGGGSILVGTANYNAATGGFSIVTNGGARDTIGLISTSGPLGFNIGTVGGTFNVALGTDATSDLTLTPIIGNSGSILKTGTGRLTFTGVNTYSGTTTIANGTLIVNATTGLGNGSATNTLIFTGGTLQAGGTITSPVARTITLTSTGLIDTNNNAVSIAGIMSGAGGLTKSGPGTLTLSGVNTYSGGTSVTGGTLRFSTAAASATNVTVAGGAEAGALVAANDAQWVNTGNLTLQNNGVALVDYGSTAPSVTVAPISVTDFANGTTPGVKLVGSSLASLAVSQAYPLATWTGSGPVDGSAFDLRTHRLTGTFSVSSNTLFLTVTNNAIAPISWNTGNGDWDTSTANWVDSNLATTTYVDTLDTVLFGDAAGATGNPTVTLATAYSPLGVTMNSTGHDYTVSGAGSIGGSGALTLASANTRTFTLATANNSFTGGTTVNGGTLVLGDATNTLADTGAVAVDGASAILSLGSNSDTVGAVSLKNGATITGSGTLTGTSYALESGSVSAILGGTGALTKSTAGTVILSGTNTITGATTISGGTLRLANTGALASTASITLNTANTTLELGTDSAFTTLPLISGGSNLAHTIVSDRATVGAALNHQLGTMNFGASTFNFTQGANVSSGTAGITFASATMSSGTTGTTILNPTTATLTILGGVTGTGNAVARPLNLGGTSTGNSIGGVISNGTSNPTSLTKSNTSTWTLSGLSDIAASNYSGTTTIDQGTLAFTTTDPSFTGGLTFGTAVGSANTGSLDLSGASASFAGAVNVQTNSPTDNTITVGSGKALTFSGTAFNIGWSESTVSNVNVTKLTINGATSGVGSLVFNNPAAVVQVGVGAPADLGTASDNTLDLTTLGSVSLGTIAAPITTLNVGFGRTTKGTLLLSDTANVITATTLNVGNSNGGNAGPGVMTLGTGTNVLNLDTINIGFSKASGTLGFALQTTGSPGTVTIVNKAGANGLAALNVGSQNGTSTGGGLTGTLDLRGHMATVNVGVVNLGRTNQSSTGNANGIIRFDEGTFDATSLNLGIKSSSGTGSNNANAVNIDGGTFAVSGAVALSAHTGTGATGNVTSKLNITNGTVNLGSTVSVANKNGTGGGVAAGEINVSGGALNVTGLMTLATQASGGTATGLLNLTGGVVTSNADIVDGGGAATSTITLNGATLDMTGKNIGDATNSINALNFQSGTLQNVAQINNGAGWTKSTTGTLILAGTNTYTGVVTVNAGTLSVTGTLNTSSALAVGGCTLSFSGAAPQTVSGLTVNAGSSIVTNTNAGATNVLNLGAITRNAGGYVNFANATASNNVIQTSTPNTNGILGSWAFVGSDLAMNDGSGNIVAYAAYADVARRTPGIIADDSTSNVRIVEGSGSLGPIPLGASTTTVNTLLQSDSGGTSDATVDVGSTETLRTNAIVIQPLAGALTVGTAPSSGTLTTATVGGDLVLTNNSTGNPMTLNSVIADNTSASPLIKLGAGTVVLNGTNTYTGTTTVSDGTLRLGGTVASTSAVVTNGTLQTVGNLSATAAVTLSGTSTLDLFGADQTLASLTQVAGNTITNTAAGTGTNTLTLNPPTPVTVTIAALVTDGPTAKTALRVGNANANTQITTNSANTFSGGLILANPPSGAGTRLLVGSAISGTPWGSGPIVIGETNTDKAGIMFITVGNTFANPIILNTALGSDRFGIRNDGVAITLSGLITANADVVFTSNNATASTTTLTSQVTGSGGLAVDLSQTSTANTLHTVTLSTTPGTNDYAGDTQIGRTNVAPSQNYTANLYLGAADQIPDGAGKGNVIINNNTGTRIGFFSLQGFSETINGLSGNGTLDSTTGTPTLTLGGNNATASFSGVIQDTAGTLTLTKIGSGTQTFSGANTFDGALNVNGGLVAFATSPATSGPLGNSTVVNLNAGGISYTAPGANLLNRPVAIGGSAGTVNVASSTGILTFAVTSTAGNLVKTGPGSAVISGSTELNLLANGAGAVVNGGILQAGFGGTDVATLSVGNTGTLDLSDATAEALTLGTSPSALTLNDGAALGFEIDGATNDSITVDVGGTAVTNGTVTLNLFNTGSGVAPGTYTLLSAPSGLAGATYALGAAPSGFNYVINTSATVVSVTVTADTPIYWRGGQDALWNTLGSAPANWTLDLGGVSDASSVPVLADSVIFSATGAPVSSDINAAFTVDSLRFLTGHTITASGPGALTLTPATSTNGIRVLNGAGTVTISVPLTTGTAQTWNVDPTGSLIVSGNTTFTGSVNKTNTGPLTLSGTNSGAGAITLTAGTLNLNSATALGSGLFSVGAGTALDSSAAAIALTTNNVQNWNGDFTFTGSNDLDLGNGAVTLANSLTVTSSANTLTVGGIIGGSTRSLTKTGAGALTLSGANTYDGGTILTAGALNLTGNNTFGSGGITINGGVATVSGSNTYSGGTTLNAGTLTLSGNNAFGSGGITINGGIATVSGANTYSGGTTLNAGTLNLGNAAALGSGTLTVAGGASLDNSSGSALTLSTNNAQTWNGNFSFTGTNSLNLGTGAVTLTGNRTATVNANTLTVGGNISGTLFGLTKAGAGALTLAGANTYTGNTTVTGGILNITGSHTAAAASLNYGTAAANTVVNVSGNMTLLSTNGANNAGSAAVYNQTAGTVTLTTATQFGSFVANNGGYGYFNLTGGTFQNTQGSFNVTNNTSTASTGVAYVAGNMNLSASNGNMVVAYSASTKASLTVAPGGTLNYGGSSNSFFLTVSQDAYGVLNVAGGNVDFGTRAFRFGNAGTGQTGVINLDGGTFTIGQNGSTAATTSANLYVNHAGGTLKAAANLSSPFSPGGVLTTVSTIFGPIDNPGTASDFNGGMTVDTNTFNMTEASVLRGATVSGVNQASLSVSGGSGYTGAPMVQFTGGTLAANGTPAAGYAVIDAALGTVTGIVITSPGTYTAAPTVTLTGGGGTGASVTVGALAANTSGGLTKTGLGTLTLTGTNTYTGGTNINQGNLVISGTGVIANNAANTTTIENGGTLTMGRNDTWGTSATGVPVIPIVINAGGIMTTGGSSFNTLGSLSLNGGTLTTAGGTNANFPSWALRGTVTVGGSVASTISAGAGTFNAVNLGANSVTGSTFNVADVTGDANADLTVSALLQNGSNASNVAQASSLTKDGIGKMTLSGLNTFTGNVLINGGTVVADATEAGSAAPLGAATNTRTITVESGATLQLARGKALKALFSSSNIPSLIINGTVNDTNLSNPGNNPLGNVTLNGGTLTASVGNGSGYGSYNLNGTVTSTGTSLISSTAIVPITLSAAAGNITTFDIQSGTLSVTAELGQVTGDDAQTSGLTKSGAGTLTLSGANTYTGNTLVNAGTLELADNAQLKFVLGATSGSNNSISGTGTVTLEGDFVIDTSAADALATGTWTLENVTSLSGAYGSNFTVAGFTNAGGNKWTKDNGPTKKYTFDETTGVLTLAPSSAYVTWAASKGLTGAPGFENGKNDDPDGDGKNNLYEFAFDGDPLSGANDGKIVGRIGTVGADQVLTLTLPVRTGATFTASSGDQLSALVDGITYRIEGDVDLSTFADGITEVIGGDATAIQAGPPAVPTPATGWTLRTFRVPGTVAADPKAFLRAKVSE